MGKLWNNYSMKPEIVHIGFSKSASTYLQSIFQEVNDVDYCYKSGKFDVEEPKEGQRGAELGLIRLESDEHIILPEWHPILHRVRVTRFSALPKVFTRIIDRSEHPKVILVIRNQYHLIVSRYSQFIVGSGGKLHFQEFLDAMIEGDENYFDNRYHRIQCALNDSFEEQNVKVLIYEEINKRGAEIVEELNQFTGLTFTYKPAKFRSRRKGLSKRALNWVRILNSLLIRSKQPKIDQVRTRIPKLIYVSLVRVIRLFDSIFPGDKLILTNEQHERISALFSEDNERLAKSLNRNLSELGYH
ncbi:MAG: sulfotransferase domain-containing protein [Cytophagales bacterium]|nr:sulfotransferase domain-containing protein [Cytophagales bacterium]